jgi:hypothetical protein
MVNILTTMTVTVFGLEWKTCEEDRGILVGKCFE